MDINSNIGITIYVDHKRTTNKGINIQLYLAKFFLQHGVHRNYIMIYDIAYNYDKQAEIKKHSIRIPNYPYIEINGVLWGEGAMVEEKKEEVLALIQPLVGIIPTDEKSEIIEAFVNNKVVTEEEIKEESESLQLGYIDASINVTEWLLFGLVKGIINVAWQASPMEVPKLEDSDYECKVIRTNWYGRHQIRTYRFTPSEIYRMDEGVIKDTLYYVDIKELVCQDQKNIIIKNTKEDQYIQGKEKEVAKIIEIVTSRAYLTPNGEGVWTSTLVSS
ncbi:hypothetical protein SAMD00019534_045570, partial [Acytostelium subglobosum LB1]|uniref:hypothetical protein n=1 Tax=Acytostelium subglobosum LB1 TaxID=1410327 RepID=UPI0006449009